MSWSSLTTFQRFGFVPIALILSVVSHGLFILFFTLLALIFPSTPLRNNIKPLPKTFNVETINQSQLKKFRTVGKKDGSKMFSLPNKVKTPPTKKVLPISKKQISLADLNVGKKVIPKSTNKERPAPRKIESPIKINSNIKRAQKIRQAQLQGSILRQAQSTPANAEALRNKGFSMEFETPEGVSEDELNSTEKIFYSFHKRTYRAYLSSFVSTYNRLLRQRPLIKSSLKDLHRLRAKVTYDEKGNIISIKIIKSSPSDEVHELFEDTLKDMKGLPNPPRALIKKDGEFFIYYQLNING